MLYGLGMLIGILGVFYKLFPPKNVNYFYGHKTRLALKNQDTWDEAQKFSAISMIVTGLLMLCIGGVFYQVLHITDLTNRNVIIMIVIACMGGMAVVDEAHLRKRFNSDGSKR